MRKILRIMFSPVVFILLTVYWCILGFVWVVVNFYDVYHEEFDRANEWIINKIGRD